MQDLNDKVTGGSLTADEWNEVPSELQNPIVATGQSLSSGDLNQVGKAIAAYAAAGDFYTDNGSVNVITLLVVGTYQSPPAYRDGMRFRFIAGNTNTGATTIQAPSLGVISLRDQFDAALIAGDIVAGTEYEATYRVSTGRATINKASALTNELPRNFIDGLTLSNGTDAVNDINVAAGTCKNSANDTDFVLATALGKQIDAVWAEGGTTGTPLGGFPSGLSGGVPVNGTWYRFFAIWRATGQIDAGFDTSSNAANLLADATNYTKYRQIGWIRYGTATIVGFTQRGDKFNWKVPVSDFASQAGTVAGSSITISAPPVTEARFTGEAVSVGGNQYVVFSALDETSTASSQTNMDSASTAGAYRQPIGERFVWTDSSSQIRERTSSTNMQFWLQVKGWNDPRGKE
jgi:hypothetical protein